MHVCWRYLSVLFCAIWIHCIEQYIKRFTTCDRSGCSYLDLAHSFRDNLAHLETDKLAQRLDLFPQGVANLPDDFTSLGRWHLCPVGPGILRRVDALLVVGEAPPAHLSDGTVVGGAVGGHHLQENTSGHKDFRLNVLSLGLLEVGLCLSRAR